MAVLEKIWTRPALMIFTDVEPTVIDADTGQYNLGSADSGYIYLTDDSRSPLQVGLERIEYKKRMINGRMRSYHVSDKRTFSVSWDNLPSVRSEISEISRTDYTTGWASGPQMLTWYNNHPDSFYLTLVYDHQQGGTADNITYSLETYNVFFDEFSYSVNKRGPTHDLWDISMALVEV